MRRHESRENSCSGCGRVLLTFEQTFLKLYCVAEGIPAAAGGEGSVDLPEEESAIEE